MSNEITIEDLASDVGGAASSSSSAAADAAAEAADEETGQWVLDLYERLEEDGMFQAILFGPDALEPPEGVEAGEAGEAGGVDVDAEVVADALEDVQNTVGDLRISQLVELTRDNPDLVDSLLEDHLEAAASGPDLEDPANDLDPEAGDGN